MGLAKNGGELTLIRRRSRFIVGTGGREAE
jgi:hypothetical protein